MKKLYTIILITFLSKTSFAQTNVYHPFPDSNAIWNGGTISNGACGGGAYPGWEYYSYILDGDTVIGSYTYHKVKIPFVEYNCTQYIYAGYIGYIREDVAAKKVYLLSHSNTESLLYDFSLQVGDTLKTFNNMWGCPAIITAVDSILIGSDYRKTWQYDNGYNIIIIEGIGSTWDLISQIPPSCVIFGGWQSGIGCFSQDGVTIYPDVSTTCEVITSVNSKQATTFFSIGPNPAIHELLIHITTPAYQPVVYIRNVLGTIISVTQIKSEDTSIDIENLAAGIYFAEIINGQQTWVEKFVKQ